VKLEASLLLLALCGFAAFLVGEALVLVMATH
jgi:hypothetical protein